MLIIFNIIFLFCTVFANDGTKCECDTLQIYYSEDKNINRTFTVQTVEIKGQPIYYSYVWNVPIEATFADIIWWNDEKTNWMGKKG